MNDTEHLNSDRNAIVLFDGVCNFCNSSVLFVIERDARQRFRFCQLQSESGKKLLVAHQLENSGLTSMILLQNGKAYTKSSAALRIAKQLRFAWPVLSLFLLIPKPLRDAVYDYIGNHRYQWFGKRDACWIPDNSIRRRFID